MFFFMPVEPFAKLVWCGIDSPNSSTRDVIAALNIAFKVPSGFVATLSVAAAWNLWEGRREAEVEGEGGI